MRVFRHGLITCVLLLLATVACGGAGPQVRTPRRRSVDRYVAMLESPGRAAWQQAEALVAALGIEPGQRVADVGTGSGYFLPQLNAAVGPAGEVLAQDIDPALVEVVRRRAVREGLSRVRPLLGGASDPGLPPRSVDVVLMVDVYHHVGQPGAFLGHLRASLRPGGRIVIVDFPPGDRVPVDVSGHEHRITAARVEQDAAAAGLVLRRAHDFLPYQFMLEFTVGTEPSFKVLGDTDCVTQDLETWLRPPSEQDGAGAEVEAPDLAAAEGEAEG